MTDSLTLKGRLGAIRVEVTPITGEIRLNNITKHYDWDFSTYRHFPNKYCIIKMGI